MAMRQEEEEAKEVDESLKRSARCRAWWQQAEGGGDETSTRSTAATGTHGLLQGIPGKFEAPAT